MIARDRLSILWAIGVVLAIASCQNISIENLMAPSYEVQLAEHLSNTGAKMYGAYWCPHCALQKKAFGNAVAQLPYVECDQRGVNPQVEECNAVGIRAYPTWQIQGEFYLGSQPLHRLATLSGFDDGNDSTGSNGDGLGGFSPVP